MSKQKAHNKIIITGPVGAGKTTAIGTISDVPVVQTEAKATDATMKMKENTTVAMDFGVIKLSDGNKIHLYGTPGQERFNFMWDILTKGSIGLLILIDGQSDQALKDLKYFLDKFKEMIAQTAVAIGVTKVDQSNSNILSKLRTVLSERQKTFPLFMVDARNKNEVSLLLESLLYTLNPCLKQVANDV